MRTVIIPDRIQQLIDDGAQLAVSISGGKDSQALLRAVRRQLPQVPMFAIHANLGRAEWPQTPQVVRELCAREGVELVVVERADGADLVTHIERRRDKLAGTGKPFWPGPGPLRYCTSDLKRAPIDQYLRNSHPGGYGRIISVEGIRWQESKERAKKPRWEVRTQIDNSKRTALTWNAIIDWTLEDVWEAIGHPLEELRLRQQWYRAGWEEALTDWTAHPAYVFGNERLSCSLCIPFGSLNDLQNGIRHHPELAEHYIQLERSTGFTFRAGQSLEQIRNDVAPQPKEHDQ